MRASPIWPLAAALLLPLPAAAQSSDPFSAFDRSVAATKQVMMANPQAALASAEAAVAEARRLPPSQRAQVALLEAEWLRGEALLYLNKPEDAAPLVTAALTRAERLAPNTKLHGDLLRSHGAIAAAQGKNADALRDYLRAHNVFRAAGVRRSQGIVLQDIGLIYFEAGDFARALGYFDQSHDVYGGDATLILTMQNNRAEVLRKQRRFAEAATAYRAALIQARKLDSPLLQVRILTNLAGALAEGGKLEAAATAVGQAIALARHGEAAGWQPFVYGVAARVAFDQGRLPRARQLIDRSFSGVDLKRSEMLYREYHGVAARIYEAFGDETLALAHLKAFARLENEAQSLTSSAASQLMAARFDFANQNLKISTLKQGQLQRDVLLERQRGRLTTLALAALAIIAALLAVGFASLRRSRNAVRASNAVLSEVNARLEGALKAKTEFLATTSHEIRTPLNGILGMTQVLLADGRVAGDLRDRIEVVQGAGETMKALVDDILDVAKIESGRLMVTEEDADLRRILVDVGRLWTGIAEAKGLDMVVDVDDAPYRMLTDGARVRQIVFNLMANALKFTAHGGVALRARLDDLDGVRHVVVTVSDTGIGIAEDQHEAIFEAFQQVDGGVTRKFGGTGLGLAICRNLARALGGDVTVESGAFRGSCFTLRLPLKVSDQPSAPAAAAAPENLLAGASVLILHPDVAAAGLLRLALAAEGAATSVAADLDAATMILSTGAATHLLCDVDSMAEAGDGLSALRPVLDAARARHAFAVLLARSGGPIAVADLIILGADQIILRPIEFDQLAAALATLGGDDPETFVAPGLTRLAA